MLDVHPPHHPVHAWRDFFVHIATITVGLLIAVGLEQSIEAIHRQRERNELRESLNRETEQIAHDCERVEPAMTSEINWELQLANLLLKSSRQHQPIGQVPPYQRRDFDIPNDPVYLAARASNKLDLLTQQEVQAYGELDGAIGDLRIAYERRVEASDSVKKTMSALPLSTPSLADGLGVTSRGPMVLENITLAPASLEVLYKGTISAQISSSAFRYRSRQVHGAALELQQGDRDLQKIQAAERQFDRLP
jgi:hypothetical protein